MKRLASSWIGILLLALALEGLAIAITLCVARVWSLDAGEAISLGQLVVALLLIPLAVVAFWQAREALAQSAARPDLRMAFLGEDGSLNDNYLLRLPQHGQEGNRVTLAVENTGRAIPVWWQASFDLPLSLTKQLRLGQGYCNVTQRQLPIAMDTVGDVERYVVQSAGSLALFPGPPVQIATINAKLAPDFNHALAKEYPIRFELLTDRSERVSRYIALRLEKSAG